MPLSLMRRTHTNLLLVLLCLLLVPPMMPERMAAQEAPPVVYLQYNTDLTLETNGLLHVRIVQQIGFGDEFSSAFFDIPKAFTTGIQNVRVLQAASPEGDIDPDTADFTEIRADIREGMDAVAVEWTYPRTAPGDIRTFVIEYDATGVVWLYPDEDLVRWQAVNDDRSGVPVQSSTVRLTLPPEIPLDVTAVEGHGSEYTVSQEGQTYVFKTTEPIPDGMAFEVEVHFPHGLLAAGIQDWQRAWDAEALAVTVERFQADLTIRPDGTIHVEESTELRVQESTLHQGFRTISLLYVDDVTNIQVSQDGRPLTESPASCEGCFVVNRTPRPASWIYYDREYGETVIQETNSGRVSVDWYGEPRQAPATTTITMAYDLVGALRVTPENDLLVWPVTPDYGLPIANASLRIHLPPGVDPAQVTVEGPAGQGTPRVEAGNTLYLEFDGPVEPGGWPLALTLPGDATSAAPPAWQAQFEEVVAQADADAVARARGLLWRRFLGVLALVGTGLAAVVAWVRTGRTSVREKLRGFESEPPSQLSPAIVSYLIDRKATEQGILGAVFHLATVGALEIDLSNGITLRRLRAEAIGTTHKLPDAYGDPVPVDRHLAYLFDQVLLPAVPQDRAVSLDTLAPTLRSHLPELYAQLGRDVQMYFIGTPSSRSPVLAIVWIILFGALLSLFLLGVIPAFVAVALAVMGTALLLLFGRRRTQRAYSDQGAAEAERWRRFKNYLVDLRQYGDQAAAQEILDRYFGYAVALGVEEVVLAQAESLGAGGPIWMPMPTTSGSSPASSQSRPPRPAQRPRPRPTIGTVLGGPRPKPSSPRPRPTLAGMSERLGGSLRRASSDLGALLATAAGDPTSSGRTVVLNSRLGQREMQWKPGTSVGTMLDDILKQSVSDVREIQARVVAEQAAREAARAADRARRAASSRTSGSGSGGGWSRSSSSSRSSGGFGRSSSSSSRSSSSSSRSSGGSRSGGGGRSGFR